MTYNPFSEELKKCIGKEVVVVDMKGKKHKGICRALNIQHMNVIIMTGTYKIALKNIQSIERRREKAWQKKPNKTPLK